MANYSGNSKWMNSTAISTAFSTASGTQSPETELTTSPGKIDGNEYNTVLLAVYSVVLLTGTISLGLMTHILKSSSTSVTSVAVRNLIFAHFLFLFTMPFRIYYYATTSWALGQDWCRWVSGMIHIHMYMSFLLYVVILIARLLAFYRKGTQEAQFHWIHALLGSAVLWLVVLVVVPCVISFYYGTDMGSNDERLCFRFGSSIKSAGKVFNYLVSSLIISAAAVLTALQANVLRILFKKHRQRCTSQQEFWAQLKSLFFALIMVVCFIPYHAFRIRYLEDIEQLEDINELFLSLTTLNCLDMLTFLGNRTCYMCFFGKGV